MPSCNLNQGLLPVGRTILSLCDYSGVWSKPYEDAGCKVIRVDLKRGMDVRLLYAISEKIHGIIMQPPCTHFAGSGARWWKVKGESALLEAKAIADACTATVAIYEPEWWVLENPVGRLAKYYGPAKMTFDPHEYAGWSDHPGLEAYTKRTCLWGRFNKPEKRAVEPLLGSKMHLIAPTKDPEERRAARSMTPQGFARAFHAANP